MADRDDELAESIDELAEAIGDLREELRGRERRPRFRPPTPGELLRLTDEVAIPTLLAILEANVRALEAFQRGLRLVRRERDARTRSEVAVDSARSRAEDLQRTTLDQLDSALAGLQRAAEEGSLPRDRQARELIEEARDLRDEVDRRLDAYGDEEVTTRTIEIEEGPDSEEGEPADVDVDAELETLKDQYAPDDESGESGENGETDGSGGGGGRDGDEA